MNDQNAFILDQFQTITNHQFLDNEATQILAANNWDLEVSILNSFSLNPSISDNLIRNSRQVLMSNSNVTSIDNAGDPNQRSIGNANWFRRLWNGGYQPVQLSEIPGSFPTEQEQSTNSKLKDNVVLYVQLLLLKPIEVFFKTFLMIVYKLTKFKFFAKIIGYPSNRLASYSEAKIIDPADKARTFIRDFEENYGIAENLTLPFFQGSYTQALYISKKTVKFLLVYLQSEEHDDKARFINDILLTPTLINLITSKDILIWGGDVSQSESYQVANSLQATKFPFIGLLCLTTTSVERPNGTETTAPTLSVISRIQGYSNPNDVLKRISDKISKYENMLISIRANKQEEDLSRLIRQQQDEAYQRTLARDRERHRRRAEQLERQREERFTQEQNALLSNKRDRFIRWKSTTFQDEPAADADKKSYARVAIKLNTGERVSRKFDQNSTLDDIYLFVELYQKDLLNKNVEENFNVSEFDNFKYEYNFNLISPMPRVKLEPDPNVLVRDERAVWPNGNLMMEDK